LQKRPKSQQKIAAINFSIRRKNAEYTVALLGELGNLCFERKSTAIWRLNLSGVA
jgi:hypothetical protein